MPETKEWFENIAKAGNIETIKSNLDLNIPDLNGRNIQVHFSFIRFMIKKWNVNIKAVELYLVMFTKSLKKLKENHFPSLFLFPGEWLLY